MATIIDIGANVGYFSLFSLSKYLNAKVFSYEPIPRNFQLLSKYREQNATLSWQAVNSAVAMPDQKSLVLHFDGSDEFTTAATMFSDQKQLDDIEVACTSLKEIIESNQLQEIDLLKVDCEGAEYSILYNTEDEVFEKINRMAIETHDQNEESENMQALAKYIQARNFEIQTEGDIIWAWRKNS